MAVVIFSSYFQLVRLPHFFNPQKKNSHPQGSLQLIFQEKREESN